MKKNVFMIIFIMLSICLSLPQIPVLAEKKDEKQIDSEREAKAGTHGKKEVSYLQIPQKLHIVIDPWEMDGKGQIYSEKYMIKNTGKTAGILVLSELACKPGVNSGVTVRDSTEGLHDDKSKSIYMEIKFDDRDKIVLSQKEAVYEKRIEPGEKLEILFSGEVNENALGEWKSSDVDASVTYSWKPETEVGKSKKKEGSVEEAKSKTEIEGKEETGEEEAEEGLAEKSKENTDEEDLKELESGLNQEDVEEEEIIEFQETKETNILIDDWKQEEDGGILSVWYRFKNAGESVGTFSLTALVCRTREQSGMTVQEEKENLHEGEEKQVCMELIFSDGEKMILPKERQQNLGYEVRLVPGEELSVRFTGELNGVTYEELEEGDISVEMECSWTLEEPEIDAKLK